MLSAYYLVHTTTGGTPYNIKLYNHKGGCQGTAPTIEYAQKWVKSWNINCLPYPYQDLYRNNMNTFEVMAETMANTLAPITTCTSSSTVPCEKPDPRLYDTMNFDWFMDSSGSWVPKAKGNNPMYIETCSYDAVYATKKTAPANAANVQVELKLDGKADVAVEQRKYLLSRISTLHYQKNMEIAEQFHRDEPASPKTLSDLKERLKKGLYTVDKPKYYDEDDEDEIYWRDFFSWRTPETQFDKIGYEAAYKELSEFVQDVKDQINILDPKEGLALLDELKNWKPTKAKK